MSHLEDELSNIYDNVGDMPFFIKGDEKTTFKDFLNLSKRFAYKLKEKGIEEHSKIYFYGNVDDQSMAFLIGARRIGVVPIILDPRIDYSLFKKIHKSEQAEYIFFGRIEKEMLSFAKKAVSFNFKLSFSQNQINHKFIKISDLIKEEDFLLRHHQISNDSPFVFIYSMLEDNSFKVSDYSLNDILKIIENTYNFFSSDIECLTSNDYFFLIHQLFSKKTFNVLEKAKQYSSTILISPLEQQVFEDKNIIYNEVKNILITIEANTFPPLLSKLNEIFPNAKFYFLFGRKYLLPRFITPYDLIEKDYKDLLNSSEGIPFLTDLMNNISAEHPIITNDGKIMGEESLTIFDNFFISPLTVEPIYKLFNEVKFADLIFIGPKDNKLVFIAVTLQDEYYKKKKEIPQIKENIVNEICDHKLLKKIQKHFITPQKYIKLEKKERIRHLKDLIEKGKLS